MTYQYTYGTYNPGQYPTEAQGQLDAMTAAGWQVTVASPNYSELYILWQRELPLEAAPDEPAEPAPHKHRAAQKHRQNPPEEAPEEKTSGGLRAHEGQGAR